MKVIDLYHHLSRALYYDLDKKVLIEGSSALDIRGKLKNASPIGRVSTDQGIIADVWNNGLPTIVYGNIFEL